MTAVSATVTIENNSYATIESLAGITLTAGKTYSVQIQGLAFVKIANAEFIINDEKFLFTQGTDDIYIKPNGSSNKVTLTILENE